VQEAGRYSGWLSMGVCTTLHRSWLFAANPSSFGLNKGATLYPACLLSTPLLHPESPATQRAEAMGPTGRWGGG